MPSLCYNFVVIRSDHVHPIEDCLLTILVKPNKCQNIATSKKAQPTTKLNFNAQLNKLNAFIILLLVRISRAKYDKLMCVELIMIIVFGIESLCSCNMLDTFMGYKD